MLHELIQWPVKLHEGATLARNFLAQHASRLPASPHNIVFVGMGGSGIAGRIFGTLLDRSGSLASHVIGGTHIPAYVTNQSLVFVTTYSGNTWETLDALKILVGRGITPVVLAHGGQAEAIAQAHDLPYVKLPTSLQPRTALGHFLGFYAKLFYDLGFIASDSLVRQWEETASACLKLYSQPGTHAEFLKIAHGYDIFHVWGVSDDAAPSAYRATTQFNENAKTQAVCGTFPELAHNLLVGFQKFEQPPLVLWYATQFLTGNMARGVAVLHDVLHEAGAVLYKIPVFGDTFENQLISMVLWTDFASYYLGHERGVDTQRVRIIEELKNRQQTSGIFVEV